MTALKSDSAAASAGAGTNGNKPPTGDGAEGAPKPLRQPYLAADGTLVIPFDSDPKYHWWIKGGQTPEKTKAELEAAGKQEPVPTGGSAAPTTSAPAKA